MCGWQNIKIQELSLFIRNKVSVAFASQRMVTETLKCCRTQRSNNRKDQFNKTLKFTQRILFSCWDWGHIHFNSFRQCILQRHIWKNNNKNTITVCLAAIFCYNRLTLSELYRLTELSNVFPKYSWTPDEITSLWKTVFSSSSSPSETVPFVMTM